MEFAKPGHRIAVATDNARNMDTAVNESGLSPHIKCFAHTLNLAAQKRFGKSFHETFIGESAQDCLFFSSQFYCYSTIKQTLLMLPSYKLIMEI